MSCSERSVQSQYVRDEATYALDRDKLIPVAIDKVNLPFRFRGVQTLSLHDWNGSKDFLEFRRLIEDIAAIVRGKGHPVHPPPSVPKWQRFKQFVIPIAAVAALATIAYFAFFYRPHSPGPLRDTAITLCKKITDLTGKLASSSDPQTLAVAFDRFWGLYYGQAYIIETEEKKKTPDKESPLEGAMIKFGELLPAAGDPPAKLPRTKLQQASLRVVSTCKDAIDRM